jgi:hypothetical protein
MKVAPSAREENTMSPHTGTAGTPATRLVVYGDFNCPWSYLAARRATLLEAAGVAVDWRAVEHQPWRPRRFSDSSERFDDLRAELTEVRAQLLPEEHLEDSLAGFVPFTKAAVNGYAEAYGAGVAPQVRQLLFDAFWNHGMDVGNARLVRTLLSDAIRGGTSASDTLRRWGYAVDVTGGPITTMGWRLVKQWREEWREDGRGTVPVVYADGGAPLFGRDAVTRLGQELVLRGIDVSDVPSLETHRLLHDPVNHSWATQHGNRWMRNFQDVHVPPMFPTAS